MRTAQLSAVRRSPTLRIILLLGASLLCGCATPWLESFEHEKTIHCRIDNPDRDNLWDTSDTNGNGIIDDNEHAGVVFDFSKRSSSDDSIPSYSVRSEPIFSGGSHLNNLAINPSDAVVVNFATPHGFLNGFRDYAIPQGYPTSFGPSITSGDGIADDLDGNNSGGFFFVTLGNQIVGSGVDFDDLHTFNIRFDRLAAAPHTETYGMQVARSHLWKTKIEDEVDVVPANQIELAYGIRYMRLRDAFSFEATGSILGRTFAATRYDNEILGPQLALNWNHQQAKWSVGGGASLMLGQNLSHGSQFSIIGESIVPGGVHPISTVQPNQNTNTLDDDNFSTIAEAKTHVSYAVSKTISVRLGYTALYISDLRYAYTSMRWSLPDMGLLPGSGSDDFYDGVHASVELRR